MPTILRFFQILMTAEVLKPLLARIVVYLGISVVSYVGFGAVWSIAKAAVISNYGGLPATTLAYLAIAKVDKCLSVILSAYGARLTIKGLTAAGTLKQVLWKPYQQGALFPGT